MKQGGHYLLLSLLLSFLYNAHVEVRAIVTLDRVKSVVHHVEEKVFDTDQKCDLVCFNDRFNNLDRVQFALGNGDVIYPSDNNILHRVTHCAIALLTPSELVHMDYLDLLLRPVVNALVIVVSDDTETAELPLALNFSRTILRIGDYQSNGVAPIDMFCPNATVKWKKAINFWIKPDDTYFPMDLRPKHHCPSILFGQKIKAHFSYVTGHVLATPEGGVGGFEVNTLRIIAEKLQFELLLSEDDYGAPQPDGSWTGMAGKMVDRTVDISFGACSLLQPYYSMFGYSVWYYDQNVAWISRVPIPIKRFDNLIRVFSGIVWTAVLFSLFAMATMFLVIHLVYQTTSMRPFKLTRMVRSKLDFFLLTFCSFTEPDPLPWFPNYTSGRATVFESIQIDSVLDLGKFLTLIWSLAALNICAFYNCNLRSRLIAKTYEKPIESAEDVLARGASVYTADITKILFFVNLSPSLQKVLDNHLLTFNLLENNGKFPDHMVQDVHDKGSSLVSSERIGISAFMDDKTRLGLPNTAIKGTFLATVGGYWIPKHAAWKPEFDQVLSRLFEAGITEKLFWSDIPPEGHIIRIRNDDENSIKIDVSDMAIIFIFWTIGLIIGFLVFLVENKSFKMILCNFKM